MGNDSESRQVLKALSRRIRSKSEGKREFVFRNGNEACRGLELNGKMRTRTVMAMLDYLRHQSLISMVTFDGVTTITIPEPH